MERKILISNVNYDSKLSYHYLSFKEEEKEILFTGKKSSDEFEERIELDFRTNDLLIERVRTDEIKAEIEKLNEDKIKIKINDLEAKRTFLNIIDGLVVIEGKKIKGFLSVGAFLESIRLEDFERVELEYLNLYPKKVRELKLKNGEFFVVKSRRGVDKVAAIETIYINDVKVVDLRGLKIRNFKNFEVVYAEKLKLNLETIRNLRKENAKIRAYFLSIPFPKEEDLKVLIEKGKEGVIEAKILEIQEVVGRDSQVDFKKLIEEEISISDILKVRNIEIRRMITKFFGGLKELIKNERGAELIEKTERGELWRVKVEGEEVRFLKYKDISTDREYISFVPPNIQSVDDGFAWKFNITKEEYQSLTAEA